MKTYERDGLWRALEALAADLESAKAKGTEKAFEYKPSPSAHDVAAFEASWTEAMCKEGAARIRGLCDIYLKPKRARKAA